MTEATTRSSELSGTSAVMDWVQTTKQQSVSTTGNLISYPDTNGATTQGNQTPTGITSTLGETNQTSLGANYDAFIGTNSANENTSWTSAVETWTSNILNWASTETNFNRTTENWTAELGKQAAATNWTTLEPNWSLMQNSADGNWFSDNGTIGQLDWLTDDMAANSTAVTWTEDENIWTTATAAVAEAPALPLFILYVYFSLRVLWALFTIIGNAMTIFIIARFEEFHRSSNYLICSLAVADLTSIFAVPLTILQRTYANSDYFVPLCLTEQTVNIVSLAGSLVNIMYITIDRYIYIAFPLRYQTLVTSSRTLALIFLTWTYYVIATPLTVYFANRLTIGMPCQLSVILQPYVYVFYLTPQFFILLFLTIGFNIAMAKIAFKQSRAIAAAEQAFNPVEAEVSKRTSKISRMLGTVLGAYLLCIIPPYAMAVIVPNRGNTILLATQLFTLLLYWGSNWVNPIIYVWRLKQFRVALKRVLTGQGDLHDFAGAP